MRLNFYSEIVLIGALISGILTLAAWQRRKQPGSVWFILLMLAVTIYSFGYSMELASLNLAVILAWVRFEYLGIASIPVLWVATVLHYTGHSGLLTRRNLVIIFCAPVLILLVHYTNPLHGLFYKSIGLETNGLFPMISFTPGVFYWVNTAFLFTCMVLGIVLLIQKLFNTRGIYRKQAAFLVAGASAPLVAFILYISGLSHHSFLDLTPFSLIVTGLLYGWGSYGYNLFDLAPIARERVLEDLSDAVIVLDDENRLVDCNPAALYLFSWERPPVRQSAQLLFANWPALLELLHHPQSNGIEIVVGENTCVRAYEWNISILTREDGQMIGVILLAHDVTERNRVRSAERHQRNLAEALRDTATILNSTLDLEQVFSAILDNLGRVIEHDASDLMLIEGSFARLVRQRGSRLLPEIQQNSTQLQIAEVPGFKSMLDTCQPLIIPDTRQYPDWVSIPGMDWLRSYAAAPIVHKNRVIGFINVTSAAVDFYTPEDAIPLKAFADQAAIAISNARMFSSMEWAKDVAETAIQRVNEEIAERQRAEQELRIAKEAAETANQQLIKVLEELERSAVTDKLTGVYNRRKFDELASYETNRANRYGHLLSLILFDMDHLKQINDVHGHTTGDQVIIELAGLVKSGIRSNDTIFRWGGDEFVILAPDVELKHAVVLGEKIRALVAEHEFPQAAHTTISLGVTAFLPGDSTDSMLARADNALYRAKKNGRNRLEVEEGVRIG